MNTEEKEAALSGLLRDPGYSHAENIFVALRIHEESKTPHAVMIDDLFDQFITREGVMGDEVLRGPGTSATMSVV